jgi:hypothetical protein
MKIPLYRKTIVQLYCLFSEAERSVHRLLDPSARWPEFQQYYGPGKMAALGRTLELLTSRLSQPLAELPQQEREQVVNGLQPPGLFRILF